jgi:hypothetical protein
LPDGLARAHPSLSFSRQSPSICCGRLYLSRGRHRDLSRSLFGRS